MNFLTTFFFTLALKKLGMKGMWKGLLPRIFMIGTLTGAQWFIYDYVKLELKNHLNFKLVFKFYVILNTF